MRELCKHFITLYFIYAKQDLFLTQICHIIITVLYSPQLMYLPIQLPDTLTYHSEHTIDIYAITYYQS